MSEQKVLDFISGGNRPYTVQVAADNLAHHHMTKKMVQKSLESLAEAGKIVCKDFGKTKVYYPLQTDLKSLSKEEMETQMARLSELAEEAQAEQAALKQLKAAVKVAESTKTIEELNDCISAQTAQIEENDQKLRGLKAGGELISAKDKAAAEKDFSTMMTHWAKRKRIFNDIWGAVSENMDGNPKDMFEEIGIDTDQMVQVDYKLMEALMSRKRRL